MTLRVHTGGKLLFFGAYSLLLPKTVGYVYGVDKGINVLGDLDTGITLKMDDRAELLGTLDKQIVWSRTDAYSKYVRKAVEFSYQFIQSKGISATGVRLEILSDPELKHASGKTGIGSSAAVTVAVVSMVLALHGLRERSDVFRVALYSHYVSQGEKGSGFDIAGSCFGSCFFTSGDTIGDRTFEEYVTMATPLVEPYPFPPGYDVVAVYTGKSASTAELMGALQKTDCSEKLQAIGDVNKLCASLLRENKLDEFFFNLMESWKLRKQLGEMAHVDIESDEFTKLNVDLCKHGAHAVGLSGAGGGDSIVCFVNKENRNQLLEYLQNRKLPVLDLNQSTGYAIQ